MSAIAIALHVLAAVVWVGGMFFAYMAARPVLAELDTPLRAKLWVGIFRRFFPWVWVSVATLLATGTYMVFDGFGGFAQAPAYVDAMMGLGVVMMALFGHVFFSPYRRLQRALADKDDALAMRSMRQIRLMIAVNLSLGLAVILIAMLGSYATFN
jgi:uncharacterized membrane protein